MKKIIYCFIFIVSFCGQVFAQNGFMLRNLSNTPQSLRENPGVMPQYKWYVGFPGISGIQPEINSPVNFGNIIHITNDLPSQFNDRSRFVFDGTFECLAGGFKMGKNYFSVSFAGKSDFQFNVHPDLIKFLINGNEPYLGKKLTLLDSKSISANIYSELALGLTHQLTDQLSVGGRLKYLVGFANLNTKNSTLTLYTDDAVSQATLGYNLDLNFSSAWWKLVNDSSGVPEIKEGKYSYPQSNGWGIDLGANYKVNDKIEVNVAILDLGFITWRDNVSSVYMPEGGEFEFTGFSELWDENGNFNEKFYQPIIDSLEDILKLNVKPASNYTTSLKSRFVVGGSYKVLENGKVGLAYQGAFANKKMYSTLNVSYTHRFGTLFEATVGNTFQNQSAFNPGIGFCLGLGPFQLYTAINQVSSLYLDKIKNVNFIFGMNFVFGSQASKKKKDEPMGTPPSS